MEENSHQDKKSLKIITGQTADWKELAKDCVCFANGAGGTLFIGIENNADQPDPLQKISDALLEQITKKISGLTINVGIAPVKETASNGGEFIALKVFRSVQSIASTSDGKYYMRVSDECKPIMPEDLARLASDKNAFVWEEKMVKRIPLDHCDRDKYSAFVSDIQNSERVSEFIKQLSNEEIAEHYFLTKDGYLTNLGVLWIGLRADRATLHYPPAVQFIKYDISEKKVFKKSWDDYSQNPKEIIADIIEQIPDWQEFEEVADGSFRKNIFNYPVRVIRELVSNAFAHRNYTMRGDIFINLYHDRLEIHSPGLLPLGVTPANILTKTVQRNRLISNLFYDLKLMEKEGSGYDLIYEILLGNAKERPIVEEGDDRVTVTIKKQITDKKVLKLMSKASSELNLKQREVIALGIIAQNEGISTLELSDILNSNRPNGLSHWLGSLIEMSIIQSKGKTKGTLYYVNPDFLRDADFIEKTNLKRIEPHRLKHLILEDLKNYPGSALSEIQSRVGEEIHAKKIKRSIDEMIESNDVIKEGEKKGTKYFIGQSE